MITENMIHTVESILGNIVTVGAESSIPTRQAQMLNAREMAEWELSNMSKSLVGPMADYVVRAHMSPNGMIKRELLSVTETDLGMSKVTGKVALMSEEELSYLTTFILKLRQSRMGTENVLPN